MGEAEESGAEAWIELLATGMTFDLRGLAPGSPTSPPFTRHAYGLADDLPARKLEAVTVAPGAHLAAGARMVPVVRALARLTARLSSLPGVEAVAWHPARCWSAPAAFGTSVLRWIDGGPFPGFCLAALAETPDGALQSEGLALFAGQELRIEPDVAENRSVAAKVGLRLMHWLAETGPVTAAQSLQGPAGQALWAEPSANQRFLRVRLQPGPHQA